MDAALLSRFKVIGVDPRIHKDTLVYAGFIYFTFDDGEDERVTFDSDTGVQTDLGWNDEGKKMTMDADLAKLFNRRLDEELKGLGLSLAPAEGS